MDLDTLENYVVEGQISLADLLKQNKRSKYRNRRTTVKVIRFDSKMLKKKLMKKSAR